jgi:hypothetical protein
MLLLLLLVVVVVVRLRHYRHSLPPTIGTVAPAF